MRTPPSEPIFFGRPTRPLFGWVHRANESVSVANVALVIVNPFGYEAVCAHRSLRHLANAAATAGIDAIRFDLDGTGDSAGSDTDANRLDSWLESVHCAADTLRSLTSRPRIVLFGIRLGATLASLAAASRGDVAGVAAFAPVVVGRTYLRELKILQSAVGVEPGRKPSVPGVDEVVGFALTEETRASFRKIDLGAAEAPIPARDVLLLERDDLPSSDPWHSHLLAMGARVTRDRVPGYVETMLDPHKSIVPEVMIAKVVRWASSLSAPSDESSARSPEAFDAPRRNTGPEALVEALRSPYDEPALRDELDARVVRERAFFFSPKRRLFGVTSSPREISRSTKKGILLINAGSVHHIGPNRLYVNFARRWAAAGHTVMRFDVSGIGDSPCAEGESENVVYTTRGIDDIGAACEFLRREKGVTDVYAIGLCSGAYNSLKAVVAGVPLAGAVLVNPLTFSWRDGMSLDYPEHKVVSEASRYSKSALSLTSWKKVARGKVRVIPIAQVMARRGRSFVVHGGRHFARRLGMRFANDLPSELLVIAERSVPLNFVFATGEPGLDLLRLQGGRPVETLRGRGLLHIVMIEGANHTFTPIGSHDELFSALDDALTRRSPSGGS